MQAREIMTENPVCATATETLQAVAQKMVDNNCGLLPIVDNYQNNLLIGVVSDRDIVCRVVATGKDCTSATVQDAMSSGKLWTVHPDDTIDDVIERMEDGQVRRIPVVDDMNHVLGIISTADVALEIDESDDIAEVFEEISEPTNIPHA